MDFTIILALFTVFLFGLRHGLDYDHIAAIFGLSTIACKKKENLIAQFSNSFSYIFGHAFIVAILGLLVILIGFTLPESFNTLFERIIGFSLIILGLYLLIRLLLNKTMQRENKIKEKSIFISRADIILNIYYKIGSFLSRIIDINKIMSTKKNSIKKIRKDSIPPFLLGIIHGIGAETPSQLLLLIVVGGLQGIYALIALIIFIFGLIISNTILSLISLKLYNIADNHKYISSISIASAVFSLILGISIIV